MNIHLTNHFYTYLNECKQKCLGQRKKKSMLKLVKFYSNIVYWYYWMYMWIMLQKSSCRDHDIMTLPLFYVLWSVLGSQHILLSSQQFQDIILTMYDSRSFILFFSSDSDYYAHHYHHQVVLKHFYFSYLVGCRYSNVTCQSAMWLALQQHFFQQVFFSV